MTKPKTTPNQRALVRELDNHSKKYYDTLQWSEIVETIRDAKGLVPSLRIHIKDSEEIGFANEDFYFDVIEFISDFLVKKGYIRSASSNIPLNNDGSSASAYSKFNVICVYLCVYYCIVNFGDYDTFDTKDFFDEFATIIFS